MFVVESEKNPSQLTEEDLRIIDQVFIACATKYYHYMETYKTPKIYAEKYLIKAFKSNNALAAGRIVTNSLYYKYNGMLVPGQINEDLANEYRYRNSSHNVSEETDSVERFLDPPQLKRVLYLLENEGLLFNIVGKDEIMLEFGNRRLRGRPRSSDKENSSVGGRPSAYKITEIFDKIRKLVAKPEAQELLKKKLLGTRLTYKYERFNLEAIALCARIDPSVAENLITMVAPPDQLPKLSELRPFIQYMASLDDDQLKTFLNEYSKSVAEMRPYDWNFLQALSELE